MKKILCALLCLTLLLGCCAATAEQTATTPAHKLETKSFPLYMASTTKLPDEVPLYFVDGVNDMPYIDMPDMLKLYEQIAKASETDITMTGEFIEDSKSYAFTNTSSGSILWIDFGTGDVIYSAFDSFGTSTSAGNLDVLFHPGINAKTQEPELFERRSDPMMNRPGTTKAINLDRYLIPYIAQDGKYLLPLHTAMDLVVCMPGGGLVNCFNGQAIFLGDAKMFGAMSYDADTGTNFKRLTPLGEIYYQAPKTQRSKELAQYGLAELCMELDHFYGLKEAHNVNSFMDLLLNTQFFDALLDTDPEVADGALQDFINYYLDDLHSGYNMHSWMTGQDAAIPVTGAGFSTLLDGQNVNKYGTARSKYYPDGYYAYEEVGHTAFVTFDSFGYDSDKDYYALDLNDKSIIEDTLSLIMYAHHQITRADSPITDVVLDLSNNTGGQADAAVYTIGWFLGNATITNVNTFSGAQATCQYAVDVNLDRVFDERDSLAGRYNLYCLTSPVSFSCGNLVPWVFKASGMVTLAGTATGGGSCIVQGMSTAWGSVYQLSGSRRLAFVKNGSYYDVDRGVEPDITLTKTDNFYDRAKLAKILDESN